MLSGLWSRVHERGESETKDLRRALSEVNEIRDPQEIRKSIVSVSSVAVESESDDDFLDDGLKGIATKFDKKKCEFYLIWSIFNHKRRAFLTMLLLTSMIISITLCYYFTLHYRGAEAAQRITFEGTRTK